MIENLEDIYGTNVFSSIISHPFQDNYKKLTFQNIHHIIAGNSKITTTTKIMFFKSWWTFNEDVRLKSEVQFLLDDINMKASYIPRRQIIFMRNIRDEILKELVHL